MTAIDFTELKKKNKAYAGANGNKISVIYEGEQYMLKFPAQAKRNPDMSYSNSCFSEYLGCQIYESIGIPVQKTLLGTYTVRGKKKIVVACRDFTEPGVTLQDFASLKNQMIDSERNGYGTELVPGVTSFCAAAARLNIPLTEWDEPMHVIPALHKLDHGLDQDGTYVLMKSGSHMQEVKEILRASGKEVQMVQDCGMPSEQVYRSVDEIPDDAGYFALIVAKNPKETK